MMVKSNYNYCAVPERSVGLRGHRSSIPELRFDAPANYRVYDRLELVPRAAFHDPNLNVEKFQPEFEGGLYHVRLMVFLGSGRRARASRRSTRS